MVTLKHDDKLQDGSECAIQVFGRFTARVYSKGFMIVSSLYITLGNLLVTVDENILLILFWLCILFIIQCALLYTTVYGQRRIRVITLSLPVTSMLSNLFRAADLDTQFCCFLKQGKYIIYPWYALPSQLFYFWQLWLPDIDCKLLTALYWILLALFILNVPMVVSFCSYFRWCLQV